jgi:SAM-dependent methyltransferase
LNCGNGMAEQALFNWGVIRSVVGVDVSGESLVAARLEAERLGLPAEYLAIDVNVDDLPAGPFDLVLNHAALHHVAFIDNVVRGLRRVIADDGELVHYDYTGPHRNQYATDAWGATVELNASFPAELRRDDLTYPHLSTMLVHDPTEAVHSELVLETLFRYFDADPVIPLGGAIAYPLLHQNVALHERQATEVGVAALARIIELHDEFTAADPARSLFTFAVMTPRPGALHDSETLARWTVEEVERERRAARTGNEYYTRTAFSLVYGDLADEQIKTQHITATNRDLAEANQHLTDTNRHLADTNQLMSTTVDQLRSQPSTFRRVCRRLRRYAERVASAVRL